MRKFLKLTLLILGFFTAYSAFAFNAPDYFVVHNDIKFVSKARAYGQWSQPVAAHTVANIPWAAVDALCKHKTVCKGQIFVFKGNHKKVKAGSLSINTNTGAIVKKKDKNGFHISVNGPADVTLSR